MANWSNLKAAIAKVIKNNGNQEITGQVLQNVLNNIVSSIGENATFAGIATPTTNPGAPDGNIFYLAGEGIYANFSNLVIDTGQLGILRFSNGVWSKQTLEIGAGGGNMILEWNTDVATTRKQVLSKYRKSGIQISYNNGTEWVNEQYIGTVFKDSEWQSDYNWKNINAVLTPIIWKSDTANYWYSEPIPVRPLSKYIIETNSVNNSSMSKWLDINGDEISNVVKDKNITEAPENAYFIILRHYNSTAVNTKFWPINGQLDYLTPLCDTQKVKNSIADFKENIGYNGESINLLKQGVTLDKTSVSSTGISPRPAFSCTYIEVNEGDVIYYSGKNTQIALLANLNAKPLLHFSSFVDGGVINVISGTKYIAVNTVASDRPTNSKLFKDVYRASSDYNITDFPTKKDFYTDLKLAFNSRLKGTNIFTNPELTDSINVETFLNMENGTTTMYPYAVRIHADDVEYGFLDEILGNSIRVKGTFGSTMSYFRIYISLPSKFIKEKGYSVGDKLRLGFYARNVQPSNNVFIGSTFNSQLANNSDDKPIFVIFPEVTIKDLSKPVIFYNVINGTNASYDFRLSKICIKNTSIDGEMIAYETNEDYELNKIINGKLGEEVKPIITDVFNENKKELYDEVNTQLYGQNLVNIRRKLRTMNSFGKPKDSIRIVLFADSIWGSGDLAKKMQRYFNETWGVPEENIDIVSACYGGYEVWAYAPCIDGAVIQPNVDLFIFSDVPYPEVRDQLVAKVRNETNADIMIGTWTIQVEEQRVRYWNAVDLAKRYKCELLDINGLLYRKVQDGTIDNYMNGVHPNAAGEDLIMDDFKLHFESERFYNEYNDCCDITEDIIFLAPELNIPLHDNIKLSEGWSTDGGQNYIKSSNLGDYVEVEFNGVGVELIFNKNSQPNNHNILLNGKTPSSLNLEYCTPIIGKTYEASAWYFHRFFAAYITAPIMQEDEDEIEFEIRIDNIVRGDNNKVTSLEYTLLQNSQELGHGNIMSDSTFTFRNGQIKIPAKVYGWDNWIENPTGDPNDPGTGYVFTVGDTMSFKVRKTWMNSIDTSIKQYLRIAGLKRGNHTIKISKNSSQETQIKYVSIYK